MRQPDGTVRKRRISYNDPGHAHELTFSCHKQLPLLSKNRTCEWFIDALDRARHKLQFELWAYVIMPEHAHVLLLPSRTDYDVARILHAIKQPVAQQAFRFLRDRAPAFLSQLRVRQRDGRARHRFWRPGGGYDRNIKKAGTAWAAVGYIHDNPVRRGLVDRPEDWEWSSARWYAGRADAKLPMDACPPDPEP